MDHDDDEQDHVEVERRLASDEGESEIEVRC
jgi:hypothetical protein